LAVSRSSGFTLIEVLVALAILAIALAAAARAVATTTSTATEVKLRLLAGFVAENRLSELAARRAWPAPGVIEGSESQAGIAFAWRAEVQATPHPLFRRIEVRVTLAEAPGQELRRLVGVLPREM
jgi:general secretion pathway protein I